MFTPIYLFDVKSGRENAFVEAWQKLTELIMKHEGGLGSRLHRSSDGSFVAYAQWPNRLLWENSGSKLPPEASQWRKQMKKCCESISTTHEMEVVLDLLITGS